MTNKQHHLKELKLLLKEIKAEQRSAKKHANIDGNWQYYMDAETIRDFLEKNIYLIESEEK